jgi:hypothetical protein
MADEKKKGIWSKLFGTKKSCCCNMKIEEIKEDQPSNAPKPSTKSSCCGQEQAKQDKK